jgi:hypothetical protein
LVAKVREQALESAAGLGEPGVRQALSALFERTIQLQKEGLSSSRFYAGIKPVFASRWLRRVIFQSLALQEKARKNLEILA